MTDQEQLVKTLKAAAADGVDKIILERGGLPIGNRTAAFSTADLERLIESYEEPLWMKRVELRLGLGEFLGLGQGARYSQFAATFKRAPDERLEYGALSRDEQDWPLRKLAVRILEYERAQAPSTNPSASKLTRYDRWQVKELIARYRFERQEDGSVWLRVAQRRVIKSFIDGLTEYRVAQRTEWKTTAPPRMNATAGGFGRIEGRRSSGSVEHYDWVMTFEPLGRGQLRVLEWEKVIQLDWLATVADRTASVDVFPRSQVDVYRVSIAFDRGLEPSEPLWTFSNLLDTSRGERDENSTTVPLMNGVAEVTFVSPKPAFVSGLAWAWSEAHAH